MAYEDFVTGRAFLSLRGLLAPPQLYHCRMPDTRHGPGLLRRGQGWIKLPGPRAVPARSGLASSKTFSSSKLACVFPRAASRDGSRSDSELDAALSHGPLSHYPLDSGRAGELIYAHNSAITDGH